MKERTQPPTSWIEYAAVVHSSYSMRRTIRCAVEHEIAKRKGSRFIAAAWPLGSDAAVVASESTSAPRSIKEDTALTQVRALLAAQRAKFPTACHHCYAYTTSDGRELCSDDGEPHGTAGKPILAALQRAQLVDVCVVVSRIFGGTLLGTGGLIRAYGAGAQEVLEHAEIVDVVPTTLLRVQAPFAYIDAVKHGCARYSADVVAQEFGGGDGADFALRVPTHHAEELEGFLLSKSSGTIRVTQA